LKAFDKGFEYGRNNPGGAIERDEEPIEVSALEH
jgi:hypothetical protein